MPQVNAILETALYVADVQRAADFYRRIFGFATFFETERLIALDVAGKSVLLLFKSGSTLEPFENIGGVIPPHGGPSASPTHFAFSIDSEGFDAWQTHLQLCDVEVESIVKWPVGASSLYFRDPDHNLVELITPGFWRTA